MKKQILTFIIGLLVGAVIASLGFLIYEKTNKGANSMPSGERMQMMERPDGETPPKMPNGETQPEKPSGTENDINMPESPSKINSSTNNS